MFGLLALLVLIFPIGYLCLRKPAPPKQEPVVLVERKAAPTPEVIAPAPAVIPNVVYTPAPQQQVYVSVPSQNPVYSPAPVAFQPDPVLYTNAPLAIQDIYREQPTLYPRFEPSLVFSGAAAQPTPSTLSTWNLDGASLVQDSQGRYYGLA